MRYCVDDILCKLFISTVYIECAANVHISAANRHKEKN